MRLFYLIGLIALLLSGCDSEGSAKSDFEVGSDLESYETLIDSSEDEESLSDELEDSNSSKESDDKELKDENSSSSSIDQVTTVSSDTTADIGNTTLQSDSGSMTLPIQTDRLRDLILSVKRVSQNSCSNARVFSLYPPMNSVKVRVFDHGTLKPVDHSSFSVSIEQLSNRSNSSHMSMGGMRKEFSGECLPVTFKDSTEIYPAFKITATDGSTTLEHPITLYKSDERNCKVCHASNSFENARPSKGWANLADSESDFKINILRLHDQKHPNAVRDNIKNLTNYDSAGLEASAKKTTVRCTDCHKVNAISGSGIKGISVLTNALHAVHTEIVDPYKVNMRSCITCHPGFNITPRFGSQIMHSRGKKWIDDHDKFAEDGGAKDCKLCHGYDYQGTKMSKTESSLSFGIVSYRAGDQVSCFDCHTNTKWDLKPGIDD
jgi:nitrate/TMAO reductase-like tetraheme cytochrome c subunit